MLARTLAVHGGVRFVTEDPQWQVHRDVLYIPAGRASPGLYDRSGRLVVHAGVWRGVPEPHLALGSPHIELPTATRASESEAAVYVAALDTHYGHFLLTNLSRLWRYPTSGGARPRLLHLGPSSATDALNVSSIADMLGALGAKPRDLLHYDEPVWLRNVEVAAPSFIENIQVHATFARLGRSIGATLLAPVPATSGPPVFLSKQNLGSGVSRLVNEAAFCAVLAEAGIEIVFPETLDLAHQAALFRDRPLVAAWIGSALHTSLLASSCRLIVLNYEPVIWSNQMLIDLACKNRTDYLHFTDGVEHLGAGGSFHNNFVLRDPRLAARQVIAAISGALRHA